MSDASALVPLCPRCGFGEFVTLPGRAPRCKHCDANVGLAPGELDVVPYRRQVERNVSSKKRNLPTFAPSGNPVEDVKEQRRRRQVPNHKPEQFYAQRPISPERTRLDLRLSVDMRDQLNDLVQLHKVTASEVIRLAVEAMWTQQCDRTGATD